MAYALVIHGGAGARPGSDYTKQKQHMQQLIKTGQDMLVGGKSALDVVVWVVEALEIWIVCCGQRICAALSWWV